MLTIDKFCWLQLITITLSITPWNQKIKLIPLKKMKFGVKSIIHYFLLKNTNHQFVISYYCPNLIYHHSILKKMKSLFLLTIVCKNYAFHTFFCYTYLSPEYIIFYLKFNFTTGQTILSFSPKVKEIHGLKTCSKICNLLQTSAR